MSEKSIKRIHLIYGIVLSVLLVTAAILLAVTCINIYNEDGAIGAFTVERVSEHFSTIAAVVYTTIALVIIGGIFNTIAPLEQKKLKGSVNDSIILNRLFKKLKVLSPSSGDKIERQRIIRFSMIITSLVLVLAAAISSIISTCINLETGGTDISTAVAKGWLNVLWFFIGPFAYLVVTAYVCKRSIRKELDIVKNELKGSIEGNDACAVDECVGTFTRLTEEINEAVQKAKTPKKWHKYFSLGFKCVLVCVIITFIIVGACYDGAADVVDKANKICAECIGLG